jgi:hypothetical protein
MERCSRENTCIINQCQISERDQISLSNVYKSCIVAPPNIPVLSQKVKICCESSSACIFRKLERELAEKTGEANKFRQLLQEAQEDLSQDEVIFAAKVSNHPTTQLGIRSKDCTTTLVERKRRRVVGEGKRQIGHTRRQRERNRERGGKHARD